jgi:hypothetical protein
LFTRVNILVLGLHGPARFNELVKRFTTKREFLVVLFDLPDKLRVSSAVLPGGSELIRSLRHTALETLSHDSLSRAGKRGEEIGSSLAFWAFETHVDEELLGFICGTEVDLSTLVQDGDLVKDLV